MEDIFREDTNQVRHHEVRHSLEKPKTSGNMGRADSQRMAAGDRESGEKGQVWSVRHQQTEPAHREAKNDH